MPTPYEKHLGEWDMIYLSRNPAIFKGGVGFSFINWKETPWEVKS